MSELAPEMRLTLPTKAPIPGARVLHPAIGVLRYLGDPVSVAMKLRPASGEGIATTAKGHSAMLICYGEKWARECFTEVTRWQRPQGLIEPPASMPAIASLLKTIVLANGEEWNRRRRASVPPTTREAMLDGMRTTFEQSANELAEGWKNGGVQDIGAGTLAMTLHNNIRCLMGVAIDRGKNITDRFDYFASGLISPGIALSYRLAKAVNKGEPIRATPYAGWAKVGLSLYDDLVAIVRERRARGGTNDMLGALLAIPDEGGGTGLSDEEAVGEVAGLYAAGYETTARTLAFTLLMLACFPEVARKVQDEAAGLLHGDMPTLAQSKQLTYLDAVIRETQRLIPVVPGSIPRVAARDVEIDGLHLERGTGLCFSIFAMHHEESVYADAYTFKPERWDELRKNPSALTYRFMPFGVGPRRCVGGVLADYQLRATVAWLVQRFSLRLPENARVDYRMHQVVLEPKGPLPLIVDAKGTWAKGNSLPSGTIRRLVSS